MSRDQMFRLVSESMLANVIAFEVAGGPLKELKQAVGRDGGTVVGRGLVFQTPIELCFSEDDARQLIKPYFQRGAPPLTLVSEFAQRGNIPFGIKPGALWDDMARSGRASRIRAGTQPRRG